MRWKASKTPDDAINWMLICLISKRSSAKRESAKAGEQQNKYCTLVSSIKAEQTG